MDYCPLLFPVSVMPIARISRLGRLARGVDYVLRVILCLWHPTHLIKYGSHPHLQVSNLSLKLEALNQQVYL